MSIARLTISILALALALYILVPQLSWGEDMPVSKARLVGCHCGSHAPSAAKLTYQ